jgi:hypothetical protein
MSRRRFITGVVLAVTPLDAPASAQEYKAQQGRSTVSASSRRRRPHCRRIGAPSL